MQANINKQQLQKTIVETREKMELLAKSMRELIVSMPAESLLGYIYAQRFTQSMYRNDIEHEREESLAFKETINETQFLLEYVHAVLASDIEPAETKFSEADCKELFAQSIELKKLASLYAVFSSAQTENQFFGSKTSEVEFHIMSSWPLLRGNRYQVLEAEFFSFVLSVHNDILMEIYGVGADEIAKGLQNMADSSRIGHSDAASKMMQLFESASSFAESKGVQLEDAMEQWQIDNFEEHASARIAMDDMIGAGTANVSRHTALPVKLLEDLSYERGEEEDFFSQGELCGTPFRTLPARKKPLIKLGTDFFAVDPCFTRDASYRALLFNLLKRKPDYKKLFKERQKEMSEGAFSLILEKQLPEAKVYSEVYYKSIKTNQWSENDTLIIIDDMLYLVEAKAGAAATIASPALDFKRHRQSVQDLVIKAYEQCTRFFEYLYSEDEVSIFTRKDGKYVECGKLRHSDYRVMIPIGLTVESFAPISTFCKALPQIKPILGKHSFISISIDDLFVLKRILPTPGIFAHYMEVRQAAASIENSRLFDEFDHLGAYIKINRFDVEMSEQLNKNKASMVVYDGMSEPIDSYFEGSHWAKNELPTQPFPKQLLQLLGGLNKSRLKGWLSLDSVIRNLDEPARNDFGMLLDSYIKTIGQYPERYVTFGNSNELIFVWLQSSKFEPNWDKIKVKASAAGICTKAKRFIGVFIEINECHTYKYTKPFEINIPTEKSESNIEVFKEAEAMRARLKSMKPPITKSKETIKKEKVGRNSPCPCGSGSKYKNCHGR